jgi:hypothetical protein
MPIVGLTTGIFFVNSGIENIAVNLIASVVPGSMLGLSAHIIMQKYCCRTTKKRGLYDIENQNDNYGSTDSNQKKNNRL